MFASADNLLAWILSEDALLSFKVEILPLQYLDQFGIDDKYICKASFRKIDDRSECNGGLHNHQTPVIGEIAEQQRNVLCSSSTSTEC